MYTIEDLLEIMKTLRSENGCPWDKEQTHDSIKSALIEEAYEAYDAIESGAPEKMADELGDVLLQVAFHAQIGSESGTFAFNDVTTKICEKMIRRHPHIFGDVTVSSSDEVLTNWEEIKKREKGISSASESLLDVVRSLPALTRAQKVQKKAAKVGFDWDDYTGPLEKLHEETAELEEAIAKNTNIEEELGDLLFTIVNLSRFLKVSPEEALTNSTNKFIKRFQAMERKAAENGQILCNLTIDELEDLYKTAKNRK